MPDLAATLARDGFEVEALDPTEARNRFASWCEAFLQPVKARTGSYRYRGYHWHAFSYEFVPARRGEAAFEEYRRCASLPLLIVPESWSEGRPLWCHGPRRPDLSSLRMDAYVFPASLEWTMAFTHEQPGLGPYFTRREWVGED